MTNSEQESHVNARAFRDVMGLFATGVTIVATDVDGVTHGMTANAITSVSLDPLLVLVCVQKNAFLVEMLQHSGAFSINILSEEQEDLSNYFAGMWPKEAKPPPFAFEPWIGSSRLSGAIGALACKIDRFLDGGDHWIVTGLVVDVYRQNSPADPLLYYSAQYRRLLK